MADQTRPVTVVTDSTADVPAALAASLGLCVVPLTVRFGDQAFLDGVELGPAEFLRKLQSSSELPKTSQPATTAFETVFRLAVERGHDVVCVTIAALLSGTFNAARLAAAIVDPARVHVVDSGTVTMHLGWGAVAAAHAAGRGGSAEEAIAAAQATLCLTSTRFAGDDN